MLSKQEIGVPDFENRSKKAPSAEAGMSAPNSCATDDKSQSGSAERRLNETFANVENEFANNDSNESQASKKEEELKNNATASRATKNIKKNNKESNTHFSAQDEINNSQDPSSSSEDVPLGRSHSSATKLSTAKAASISSVASNDVKKRI